MLAIVVYPTNLVFVKKEREIQFLMLFEHGASIQVLKCTYKQTSNGVVVTVVL